jgi:hypothetical protein
MTFMGTRISSSRRCPDGFKNACTVASEGMSCACKTQGNASADANTQAEYFEATDFQNHITAPHPLV